uniref:Uncharacterized protein n=1 Tax=Arundo donax TaxID=35708 RepID=A0A0A9AUM0_ARUDO
MEHQLRCKFRGLYHFAPPNSLRKSTSSSSSTSSLSFLHGRHRQITCRC